MSNSNSEMATALDWLPPADIQAGKIDDFPLPNISKSAEKGRRENGYSAFLA